MAKTPMMTNLVRRVSLGRGLFFCSVIVSANVRGHRADEMRDATRRAASEAPGGPRC
jgi:hypothetical protein